MKDGHQMGPKDLRAWHLQEFVVVVRHHEIVRYHIQCKEQLDVY
jgi:hypothetical protein